MKHSKYDFAGWVTKNDIKCADGTTIRHNAFADQDQQTVPLVWQHDHNNPSNVLGHMELENRDAGVYGYGFLNDTEVGRQAKELIVHGDVNALSIWANKLKKQAGNVMHGVIREVSLVLAGANPGALIDYVSLAHGDEPSEDEAVIYGNSLIHSAEMEKDIEPESDEDPDDNDKNQNGDENEEDNDPEIEHDGVGKTVGEVLDGMSDLERDAVATLLAEFIPEDGEVKHTSEEDNELKTQLFNQAGAATALPTEVELDELRHSIFDSMEEEKISFQESIKEHHDDIIAHGIINMEMLFPDAQYVGEKPQVYGDVNTAEEKILAGVKKVPFSRLKNLVADFTADEARARGYVKGTEKVDQVFKLFGRETYPTTIYKKQSYDRDDIVDITEIDLVNFTKSEMRTMLNRELARAILVGDGRADGADGKIDPDKIRPIISDDELYTIHLAKITDVKLMLETVARAMAQYRGSGAPTMFIQPELLADLKFIKATDGRYLFGDIPTNASMAARLGVKEIVETTFFNKDRKFIIVNLNDYNVGATKGGQVTTFDDFDIDYNKMKYLIETRVSGSLMIPKSAITGEVAPLATEPDEG